MFSLVITSLRYHVIISSNGRPSSFVQEVDTWQVRTNLWDTWCSGRDDRCEAEMTIAVSVVFLMSLFTCCENQFFFFGRIASFILKWPKTFHTCQTSVFSLCVGTFYTLLLKIFKKLWVAYDNLMFVNSCYQVLPQDAMYATKTTTDAAIILEWRPRRPNPVLMAPASSTAVNATVRKLCPP